MRVPAPVLSQCPIPRGQGTHRLETRSASAGGSGCISLPVGARRGTSRQSPRSRPRRAWCEEAAEPWAWLTSPPGAAAGGWVLGRGGPLTGAGRAGTTFNPLLLPGPLQPCQPRPFPQPYLLPCSFPELTGLAWGCLVWPERHWGAQQGFMKDVSFPPPRGASGASSCVSTAAAWCLQGSQTRSFQLQPLLPTPLSVGKLLGGRLSLSPAFPAPLPRPPWLAFLPLRLQPVAPRQHPCRKLVFRLFPPTALAVSTCARRAPVRSCGLEALGGLLPPSPAHCLLQSPCPPVSGSWEPGPEFLRLPQQREENAW